MKPASQVHIESMRLEDIPQVLTIDQRSFPLPWSASAYRAELTQNDASHFSVAVLVPPPPRFKWLAHWFETHPARQVIGYCGFWFIVDEAHISTIAVHPQWRGQQVGEQLLQAALNEAVGMGGVQATLEVRVSNQAAQSLYRKYGFEIVGQRKRYYRDNGEDALLMTASLTVPFPGKQVWQPTPVG